MILYNVTCLVDDHIKEEWLSWMRSEHLPEVMATGKFISFRMFQIDPHDKDDTGTSYSIQYTAESRQDYLDYSENFGPALKSKTVKKYGDKVMAFRTIMEEL